MRIKLTPSFVDKVALPASGDHLIYWAESQRGFGLLVTKQGHWSLLVQGAARFKNPLIL
jgi:hypothetical protein